MRVLFAALLFAGACPAGASPATDAQPAATAGAFILPLDAGPEGPLEPPPTVTREAFLRSAARRTVLRIGMVDTIAYALRKNSEIKIARIEPKLRADDVRVARSAFEPTLKADYLLHDNTQESSSAFYPGAQKSREMTYDAGVEGKLVTGTRYRLDFLNERYRSNSGIQEINPYFTTEPLVTVTQPLLRGFGVTVNRADIIIARNNTRRSVEAFKAEAMDAISQAKGAYFNYAYAIEANVIARRFLDFARELVEINSARFAKGLASSVDLLESEAAVAEREKLLLDAEYGLKTAEDKLKYVTNLVDDPEAWNAEIELLDTPSFAVRETDLVQSIMDAFENRPDYRAKLIDLKSRDIAIAVKKNALFPTLDAVASFGLNGLGEQWGGAIQGAHWTYRDWSVGGTMTIPWGMGDRARYDQSKLEKARAILELERMEERIILAVREKVRAVDLQFRQEHASRVARDKEAENYAAQKERLAAGQVSTHDMLDYQTRYSKAELDLTQSMINYNIALVDLDREVGLTLARNNVKLEE
jgi:outer membrane protein TolC